MYFVVFATDQPGKAALRVQTKARHREHLDHPPDGVHVLQTGPWLDGAGEEAGSLLILEAASKAQIEAFMQTDPYVEAGIFAHIEVHPWVWRRGNPYLADSTDATADKSN